MIPDYKNWESESMLSGLYNQALQAQESYQQQVLGLVGATPYWEPDVIGNITWTGTTTTDNTSTVPLHQWTYTIPPEDVDKWNAEYPGIDKLFKEEKYVAPKPRWSGAFEHLDDECPPHLRKKKAQPRRRGLVRRIYAGLRRRWQSRFKPFVIGHEPRSFEEYRIVHG